MSWYLVCVNSISLKDFRITNLTWHLELEAFGGQGLRFDLGLWNSNLVLLAFVKIIYIATFPPPKYSIWRSYKCYIHQCVITEDYHQNIVNVLFLPRISYALLIVQIFSTRKILALCNMNILVIKVKKQENKQGFIY